MKNSVTIGAQQPAVWSRLTLTQRLTIHGGFILIGSIALAAGLGLSSGRNNIFEDGTTTAGTALLRRVDAIDHVLQPRQVAPRQLQAALDQARKVIDYSRQYRVDTDLAALIHEVALQEGIDPELGFRLVYVESRFAPRAVSSAGAIGLAQVMPATARIFRPDMTAEKLFDEETNLRLGFRFLRQLLEQYDGNLQIALLAYNRGPGRVQRLMAEGIDPSNGYASSVMTGYQPLSSETQ